MENRSPACQHNSSNVLKTNETIGGNRMLAQNSRDTMAEFEGLKIPKSRFVGPKFARQISKGN
jgi:hypothetical protein